MHLLKSWRARVGRQLAGLAAGVALLAGPALAQAPCPPVGGPRLDPASDAPVERYLARAVAMNGLTDELLPAPFGWNVSVWGTPCYLGGPGDDPASYVDSLTCRGLCSYPFCPNNFAADVQLLVRLRASFVQFAASTWSWPEQMIPGSPFLAAAAQTVARINAAYDCAGLRRPFIQASVLENLDAGHVCDSLAQPCEPWMRPGPPGTNSGLNRVPIPPAVIAAYRAELTSAEQALYLDSLGRPRTDVKFNFFRTGYQFWNDFYAPDLDRVEGRMWLYYQACRYLDLGFTALHLGQPQVWGRLSQRPAAERPAALHRMAGLLARIRAYARALPGQPTVLLTAEPINDAATGHRTLVKMADGQAADGEDQLLLDFSMASLHARETSPQLDERPGGPRGTALGTSYPCPTIDPRALATPACAGQPLATIDPCNSYNFVPDGGGVAPLGYYYAGQAPYSVYFDHGNTVGRLPDGSFFPVGTLQPGTDGTWGWDDSAWFSRGLREGCQADWLAYETAHVRGFSNARGFLAAPGRLVNNVRAGLAPPPGQPARPELGVPDYRLAAHPVVAAAVERLWQPTMPIPALTPLPGAGRAWQPCQGRRQQVLPACQLAVLNPDATSIYSWHIAGPAGTDTVMVGSRARYYPPQPGSYTLTLHQDNLGLPASTGGIRRLPLANPLLAEPQCLTRRAARRAARAAARQQAG